MLTSRMDPLFLTSLECRLTWNLKHLFKKDWTELYLLLLTNKSLSPKSYLNHQGDYLINDNFQK
jgi:hypothetical protein